MTRSLAFRAGMIGVLAALLLLPGCGRKGPLDPPPASSALQPAAPAPAPSGPGAPAARATQQDFDENGKPIAPPGQKQRQWLDWLLD